MKRGFIIVIMFFCLCITLYQGNAEAVLGIPDVTRASTLIVPLMEKGIASVHNTLTVVRHVCSGTRTLHWQLWDIDGVALTGISGNVVLVSGEMWVSDFGTILGAASGPQLTQVTQGSFYRGFMTIDEVSAPTALLPTNALYPFASSNCFTGYIYYVRLLEGAANGIDMVHIEGGVSGSLSDNVRGFYQFTDDREEIDNHARYYAHLTTNGLPVADDPDNLLDFIGSRVYLAGNGESRIVVWAWGPASWGTTTSAFVANSNTGFPYTRINEAGAGVEFSTVPLNHIVNVIDVTGNENGFVWIQNLPENFDVYAFSFNSANFTGNPALTWEVMFESLILAEF